MSLRDFSRRLGVSYDDLALIIQTQFINPNAVLIPRLPRLNVPFTTLKTLHDTLNTPSSIAASFIGALPAGLDATEYGGTSPTDYARRGRLGHRPGHLPADHGHHHDHRTGGTPRATAPAPACCCATPTRTTRPTCSAPRTYLSSSASSGSGASSRRCSATPATRRRSSTPTTSSPPSTRPRTCPRTSNAANDAANRPLLDAGFPTLLPRLGFLAAVTGQLSLTGAALGQLLACWAPIGTGPGSLYQAMFLTPTLLQQDPGAQTATVAPGQRRRRAAHRHQQHRPAGQVPTPCVPGDTAATAAAAIAAAVNAATAPDPDTGLPLNSRFHATSAGDVITIKAGFTLACSVAAGGQRDLHGRRRVPAARRPRPWRAPRPRATR